MAGDCHKISVVITRMAMRQTLEGMLQRPLEMPLKFEPVMDAVTVPLPPGGGWPVITSMSWSAARICSIKCFSLAISKAR